MLIRLALFICTFGYVGYFPIAPGTAGSIAGLLVYAALQRAGATTTLQAIVIVVLFVAGVWSGTHAERHFGSTDPRPGVVDEVVGMLITLFLMPVGWTVAIAGFLVFRALDVIKPYPAGRFERLHGGLGMMADDAMAAVYSNLLLRALLWILPPSLL